MMLKPHVGLTRASLRTEQVCNGSANEAIALPMLPMTGSIGVAVLFDS